MSQSFDLSPIAATISDAASAEVGARDKWVKAGKALAKAGIVSGMLVRATEKSPNALWNESVFDQVRGFIIQGVSASKKAMTFSGQKYTVAELVALKRDALRAIDDDVLRTQRRTYIQLIDGPMMSRVRDYIDRANGVEKVREKKEKVEDKTTPSEDPIVILQGMINKATTLVDVASVSRFQDAGLEMIALLRAHRKA